MITVLPLAESQEDIGKALSGFKNYVTGNKGDAGDFVENAPDKAKALDEEAIEVPKESAKE